MEKNGFVGTGAMGSALLSRLKLAGGSAIAFDIAPAALEAARKEGAETVSSAKAVAQNSTIIDVVVRTDQDVLQCTLGNDGVLEGAAPGSLVLLHCTIRPATTKKVAELAADKRVNVIKLFKNMVTASEALVVYEALQIAKAGGVSYKAALDLMQKTKSQHILDRWDMRYDLSGGELKFNPGTNLYDKDLPLAAEVGKSLGADIPVVEALAKLGIKLNGGKVSI